ncbi:MAG: amino acid ABC transporter ATP-binding protein, partial [Alphaproteobacteria bacterium]|nr:amino acid ABC transporter ATP-binding protein [Alphaproteobacteria bacterium]
MTGNPTSRPAVANARQVLQLESICLDFATKRVLHGVDLTVAEGEVVVLIGASGSGKTSLLRCINLLNSPTSGRIVIDGETIFDRQAGGGGRDIGKQEVNRIRAKTGMV